jgi:1,4-alpha-glucan branching enzyme
LLDVVHSHCSKNEADGVAGFDLTGLPPGQGGGASDSDDVASALVRAGPAGYHSQWDSRVWSFGRLETLRFLLSNARYWVEELGFDGFRFDGVTSMLYAHHGINVGFSGGYHEYFGLQTDVEACVYLMLANEMLHAMVGGGGATPSSPSSSSSSSPSSPSSPFSPSSPQPPPPTDVLTIAEDVSGMPGLCAPVQDGGLGFDARLAMAVPDLWIRLLKEVPDEHWPVSQIVSALCGRRYGEGRVGTVGYAESHDQAIVGDKTIAMWLFGAEIYDGMSLVHSASASPVIERGMALHKLITAVTVALGGEARLTFMGNEFGHPEWIDLPREGNGWSHAHARRQWSLAYGGREDLRYGQLLAWDRALNAADDRHGFVSSGQQWCTVIDDERQLLVAERGALLWVFNFSPHRSWGAGGTGGGGGQEEAGPAPLRVPAPEPGKYRVVLDSDATCFGGSGRVPWKEYYTTPAEAGGGEGEGKGAFYGRGQFLEVAAPARTAVCYVRVREEVVGTESGDGASEAILPPLYGLAAEVEEKEEEEETEEEEVEEEKAKEERGGGDGGKGEADEPPRERDENGDYVVFRF